MANDPPVTGARLREIAGLFFRLGLLGFGGPAAHIAWMQEEVVDRRGWLDRERFVEIVGLTHLIPGPNSTEIAIHLGWIRGGWRGLIVAGVAFIVPAVAMTSLFAWAYVTYGDVPAVEPFLLGVKPVVLALIVLAIWKLARVALRGWRRAAIAGAAALAVLVGLGEVAAILLGGVLGGLLLWAPHSGASGRAERKGDAGGSSGEGAGDGASGAERQGGSGAGDGTERRGILAPLPLVGLGPLAALGATVTGAASAVPLWKLGLFFLEIGAVLYGGGYVLIAFLQGGLLEPGWLSSTPVLSERELLDAIAIGQLTPGPILSTATFVGWLVAGPSGAAVSTVGIFLPSFVFVVLLHAIRARLAGPRFDAFLGAVNAAAVGLMVVALYDLASGTLVDVTSVILALVAGAILWKLRWNPAWLVLGGAALGYLRASLAGS